MRAYLRVNTLVGQVQHVLKRIAAGRKSVTGVDSDTVTEFNASPEYRTGDCEMLDGKPDSSLSIDKRASDPRSVCSLSLFPKLHRIVACRIRYSEELIQDFSAKTILAIPKAV
eukprot:8336_1